MEKEPKYRTGDRVVILDYMKPDEVEDGCYFVHPMVQYKGMTTRVLGYKRYGSTFGYRYFLEIDDGEWSWIEQWLTKCRESIEEML